MNTPPYGAKSAGCWFDGARGIYMGEAIILEAVAHGFNDDGHNVIASKPLSDYEFYHELWDEADQFMQQFAADGYWFGSNDSGDWGLWPCEECK